MNETRIVLLLCNPVLFTKEQLTIIESMFEVRYLQNDDQAIADPSFFEAEVIICNRLFVRNDIRRFANLKYVQLTSVGMDRFPEKEAKEMGVEFSNIAGCYDIPIAEYILANTLGILKKMRSSYDNQSNKAWRKDFFLPELFGKTVGIVGMGRIGKRTASLFKAFGCRIIGFDVFFDEKSRTLVDECFEEIYPQISSCDVVALTLPLTEQSKHMVDREFLRNLKESAILINTSRGG